MVVQRWGPSVNCDRGQKLKYTVYQVVLDGSADGKCSGCFFFVFFLEFISKLQVQVTDPVNIVQQWGFVGHAVLH